MNYNHYHQYFAPQNIIRLLIKYRLKYAKVRHKHHLLVDVSHSDLAIKNLNEKAKIPEELLKLFPPRKTWCKPTLEERKRFPDSQKLAAFALSKTLAKVHYKVKNENLTPPVWYKNLEQFITHIQERINKPGVKELNAPEIGPIKKEKKKSCKECRPISSYNFEDRIIISLTAKYFTEIFDGVFLDSSFAFRAVKRIDGTKIVKAHHDAIVKIRKYRNERKENEIFVAECDLQKFFDCVNHQNVLEELHTLSEKHGIKIDENAILIFNQYLKSYSFSKNVFPLNDTPFFKERSLDGAKFKWVLDDLKANFYLEKKYGDSLQNLDIGVPQGGALSCFISNLLLHSVDLAVENTEDKDLLYLRFCDDMIILHTDKQKCQEALNRYELAIKNLKLLIHPPQEITTYSKQFWKKTKSKNPYKWASKTLDKANVPWLSFVGYQIKYDDKIRVRKKSFEKEKEKQRDECMQVLKALKHSNKELHINEISRKSRNQQVFAIENRLISMAVGRIRLYERDKKQTMCWTNGFRALKENSTVSRQLRLLDANRSRNLYLIKKKLKDLTKESHKPDLDISNTDMYFGAPYSYHYFLFKQNSNE